MLEKITQYFLNLWNVTTNVTVMATSIVANALIAKYPDQAFRVLWSYNYYSVAFREFMERNNFYQTKTTKLILPIEIPYFAKCYYFNTEYSNKPKKYHLCFQNSATRFINSVSQNGETHIYTAPEYTLCGFVLPEDVSKMPEPSSAKFINVIFSNKQTSEPLTVKLEQSYFFVGNEVLTSGHIFMLMSAAYESSKFTFNDDYDLKIMDGAFNLIVLKSNEWIRFDDSKLGYVKMKL